MQSTYALYLHSSFLLDTLLVKAARGEPVSWPPAWMMRQAGRYMSVYRKLAEKHPSFRERSETTDLIVEISLQPWEAFRPDGSPICSEDCLKALHPIDLEKLHFVGESLKILRQEEETDISSDSLLLPTSNRLLLSGLRKFALDNIFLYLLMSILYSFVGYLKLQIVSIVQNKCPKIPLVLYINGNGGLLERMKGTGVDVIGLDWTVDMADGRKRLGNDICVQGNVDPAYLFSPVPAVTEEIQRVVKCAGPRGHILNLGHGVLVLHISLKSQKA
ncbi:hypothetical protein Goshw_005709 [Gossypium schwendimanii]|uniref:Uroporphyrinogen decarboxylase (URO-D) domain-containing protein n=1 Tax=Gossypium schwendimanii TaxID=34291 RepID=A0A7J9KQE3_GOSSC|nr:hypothetical protein [Gossypium schwendimanii]